MFKREILNISRRFQYSLDYLIPELYIQYQKMLNAWTSKEVIQNETDKDIQRVLVEAIAHSNDSISQLIQDKEIEIEELRNTLLFIDKSDASSRAIVSTPKSISRLALQLLDADATHTVADFGCGYGSTMVSLIKSGVRKITGIDNMIIAAAISKMRMRVLQDSLSDLNPEIFVKDIFDYSMEFSDLKYDRIMSHFPWATQKNRSMKRWSMEVFNESLPVTNSSSDWMFIALTMRHLGAKGKAVVLAPPLIEHRANDDAIRQEFVSRGYIEKVIQLPVSMYPDTSIASLLLVLSYENKQVEFIDASNMYSQEGRIRYFSEEDIQGITNPDFSLKATISLEEVLKEGRLMPAFYCTTSLENGRPLSDVAKVHRGTAYSRKYLDKNISEENTNLELIRTSHIKDGEIVDNDFLSEHPPKAEYLQDMDILVTRVGSIENSAIYQNTNGSPAVVDQSLLIIRANPDMIEPYYLYAYLQSKLGQTQLRKSYTGTSIHQLNMRSLERLMIPNKTIAEQNKIGIDMRIQLEKIQQARLNLEMMLEEKEEVLNSWFMGE